MEVFYENSCSQLGKTCHGMWKRENLFEGEKIELAAETEA